MEAAHCALSQALKEGIPVKAYEKDKQMKFSYTCSDCGQNYTIEPQLTVCPTCEEKQGRVVARTQPAQAEIHYPERKAKINLKNIDNSTNYF